MTAKKDLITEFRDPRILACSTGEYQWESENSLPEVDIRNYHAGSYCITVFTILIQRKNLLEILLEFSFGHTDNPIIAHVTHFIISISML